MRESKIAGIYIRVASDDNNEMQKQINKVKAAVIKDGYNNYKIYTETCSGLGETRKDRGALFELFDDTRDKIINRVYVNDVTRLSRNVLFVGEIFDRLAVHGCSIKFLENENTKTTENNRVFSYMRLGNAE